jgi:hypothetical protein
MEIKNKNNNNEEQKDRPKALRDDELDAVAGGMKMLDMPNPGAGDGAVHYAQYFDSEACPGFQYIQVELGDALLIKCCENCIWHQTAEQADPDLAALASQQGYVLCGWGH